MRFKMFNYLIGFVLMWLSFSAVAGLPQITGGEFQAGFTPGYVSELENSIKVDTKRISGRLDFGKVHLATRVDHIRSAGVDDNNDSLINRDFHWVGVGLHTNRGTSITYFNDAKSGDYWMLDVTLQRKIRPKITTIYGVYHFDHFGGGLIESGGRRTTYAKVGLQYDFNPHVSTNMIYEVGNNSASKVQDALFLNMVYRI